MIRFIHIITLVMILPAQMSCQSLNKARKKMEHTPHYNAKLTNSINTGQRNFGPAFYDGELIFASDFNYNAGKAKNYAARGYLKMIKSGPENKDDLRGNMGAF